MKVVLDCNVLISAALTPGVCRQVLELCCQNKTIILSQEILGEIIAVARRDKFKAVYPKLKKIIAYSIDYGQFVELRPCVYTLPDQDDLKYLQAALAVQPCVLVSGNLKDFPDAPYDLVPVLSPREFINIYG